MFKQIAFRTALTCFRQQALIIEEKWFSKFCKALIRQFVLLLGFYPIFHFVNCGQFYTTDDFSEFSWCPLCSRVLFLFMIHVSS